MKENEIKTIKKSSIKDAYIIFFIDTKSNKLIFLADSADIDAICYDSNPTLAGTVDYRLAKRYNNITEAKSDIYKLRYHHREFLKVIVGIKKINVEDLQPAKLSDYEPESYKIADLT